MERRSLLVGMLAGCLIASTARLLAETADSDLPDTVSFASLDRHTKLIGYLFKPATKPRQKSAAMVLLHGRAGPYSSLANGTYTAITLSKRHRMWGRFWAQRGAYALLVDSFGPRGFAKGFPAGSWEDRPPEVNEITVRPLDAYGALQFLTSTIDNVDPGKIGLQGWSNGGSATLATMALSTLRSVHLTASEGFRVGLAFYPGCGLDDKFRDGYTPYAPVQIFIGTADEEVSPEKCNELVEKSRQAGGEVAITVYPNATHDFDDPGRKRQSVQANSTAANDSRVQAEAFVRQSLGL